VPNRLAKSPLVTTHAIVIVSAVGAVVAGWVEDEVGLGVCDVAVVDPDPGLAVSWLIGALDVMALTVVVAVKNGRESRFADGVRVCVLTDDDTSCPYALAAPTVTSPMIPTVRSSGACLIRFMLAANHLRGGRALRGDTGARVEVDALVPRPCRGHGDALADTVVRFCCGCAGNPDCDASECERTYRRGDGKGFLENVHCLILTVLCR